MPTGWRWGDVEVGFRQADYVFEHTFTTSTVHQSYLEPMAAVAQYEPGGKLTLWTSQGHLVFQCNPDERQRLCWLGSQPAASRRNVGMPCPPEQANRGIT